MQTVFRKTRNPDFNFESDRARFSSVFDQSAGFVIISLKFSDGRFIRIRIFYEAEENISLFLGEEAFFGDIFGEIASALFYTKPLWGGEILGMEAPSLRSIFDIGLTIATSFIPGMNVFVGVALNLIDDALFTTADVAAGQMTWDEGLVSFAKKAASSFVSTGIGQIGGSITAGFGNDLAGVIGKTAMSGIQSFATNAATGAINSITYTHGGGFGFDASAYTEGLWGKNAIAGYVGGMGATFVREGLGALNLTTNSGIKIIEGSGIDAKSIASLNSLAGNAVGSLLEYGISGQTTLNLLRVNDVGIFEMRLGGGRHLFGLGMDGYNMSLGLIGSAIKGIGESSKVWDYKTGGSEKSAILDLVAGAAYSENKDTMRNASLVWSDKLKVRFEDIMNDDTSESGLGYFDRRQGDTIALSKTLLGGTLGDAAKLVSVFSHEGTHYDGNRYERVAHEAGMQTYVSMVRNLGIKHDEAFLNQIEQGMVARESFVANTGERDYWTLTKDGQLKFDGKANLYDEKGNLIKKVVDNENAVETGLLKLLYGTDPEADNEANRNLTRAMMVINHMGHTYSANPGEWNWNTPEMRERNIQNATGIGAPDQLLAYLSESDQMGIYMNRMWNKDESMMRPNLIGLNSMMSFDEWRGEIARKNNDNPADVVSEKALYNLLVTKSDDSVMRLVNDPRALVGVKEKMSFDDWKADSFRQIGIDDVYAFNSQMNLNFVNNQAAMLGAPYWWGGPQSPTIVLGDGKLYYNIDPVTGEAKGRDCCGLNFSSQRKTAADMLGVSEKEMEKYFPVGTQADLVNIMKNGGMPYMSFVDQANKQFADMTVVDIKGQWRDPNSGKIEDFDSSSNEHVMLYTGTDYIQKNLSSRFGEFYRGIAGALLIQPGSEIITTTGIRNAPNGSPDARLGAINYVGATTYALYEEEKRQSGLSVNYTFIRTDWAKFKRFYYQQNGKW